MSCELQATRQLQHVRSFTVRLLVCACEPRYHLSTLAKFQVVEETFFGEYKAAWMHIKLVARQSGFDLVYVNFRR